MLSRHPIIKLGYLQLRRFPEQCCSITSYLDKGLDNSLIKKKTNLQKVFIDQIISSESFGSLETH